MDRLPWSQAIPILNWSQANATALDRLANAIPPFVPPVIYERTASGFTEMAEHRPVTSLFVQFEFQVYGEDDSQLQRYFQWASLVVARFGSHNARLNRVLTGDKGNQLHIIFGAPVAPDTPDQAIRCALALQRERPDFVLQQRIGLAAGKVFACPVGAEKRREYTVVGDVVNLSARLTQICENGQVLTDKSTADRVREWIDFDELPPVYLKGKQEKVPLFRPRGDRSAQAQLQVFINRWQRPLVGREQELDLLLGGMDVALRSVGSVAAVFGPTGVGKTSLLAVGVKHWLDSGGAAFAGEAQQHTTDIPFDPWRSIWRDFLGLTPTMTVEEQITAVTKRTLALVPDCGDDVGLWGDALGLPLPQAQNLTNLSAEVRQVRFFSLVRRTFYAAAAQRPLLIILEGLHWADPSSLSLIDELSAHMEGQALFLAITFRPLGELALETLDRPICAPIILSDLSPKYGRELLHQLVGASNLPTAVEQHLGLRGRDGQESPVNPLFLEEAVNVMMGLGVLRINDSLPNGRRLLNDSLTNGRLHIDESLLSQMQIPDTIHGLLLARIDRLSVASRDLLQIASVIGRQFNLDPLISITPDTPRDVATDLLADLAAEEITQLMTADPEWSYLFQHAMTHEVAYESLPFSRRQTLHAAVADWLVDRYRDNLKPIYAVLAYHYGRTDNHEQGLRFALAAADSARDIFANKEAVELYTLAEEHLLALGEEERWETAVDLHLSRGEVLRLVGDFDKAIADAQQAISLNKNQDTLFLQAKSYNLMADIRYRQSQYEDVLQFAGKVIDELATAVPLNELARAHMLVGWAASSMLEYDAALTHLRRAETICLDTNNNPILARVLEGIGFTYFSQKKLEAALTAMQRSVHLSREFSVPVNLGMSLNNVAFIQFSLGQPHQALKTFEEAVGLGRETSHNLLALALINRSAVLAYLGQFDAALAGFEEAINLLDTMSDQYVLIEAYLLWGTEYSCARGDWEDARYRFEQAQKLIERQPESYPEEEARLLIGWGQIELRDGSLAAADEQLKAALAMIDERDLSWWRPAVAYLLGITELSLNKPQEAKMYLEKGLSAIEQGGSPDYLPLILLALGQQEKETLKKYAYFEQCVQTAQNRARYSDRVYCFQEAGRALVHSTQPHQRQLGQWCLDWDTAVP